MKTYTEQEVEALIREAIELAREQSFIPYTEGEYGFDYDTKQIVEQVMKKNYV